MIELLPQKLTVYNEQKIDYIVIVTALIYLIASIEPTNLHGQNILLANLI